MISRYGLFPFASSLDHCGALARSVRDVAIVVDNMKGIDARDMTSWDSSNIHLLEACTGDVKGKKVCYVKELCDIENYPNADQELIDHLENFKKTLEKVKGLGIEVDEKTSAIQLRKMLIEKLGLDTSKKITMQTLLEAASKAINTGATAGETGAKGASTVATIAQTVANWGLLASMPPLLAITLVIVAALVALAAIIFVVVSAVQAITAKYNEDAIAAENAVAEVEEIDNEIDYTFDDDASSVSDSDENKALPDFNMLIALGIPVAEVEKIYGADAADEYQRLTEGSDVLDDLSLQVVDASSEVKQFVLVAQDAELPYQRNNLCDDGSNGCPSNSPIESINEDRVENGVDNHRVDGSVHGFLWMPHGTQYRIQS